LSSITINSRDIFGIIEEKCSSEKVVLFKANLTVSRSTKRKRIKNRRKGK
jgi:hypothetical protein